MLSSYVHDRRNHFDHFKDSPILFPNPVRSYDFRFVMFLLHARLISMYPCYHVPHIAQKNHLRSKALHNVYIKSHIAYVHSTKLLERIDSTLSFPGLEIGKQIWQRHEGKQAILKFGHKCSQWDSCWKPFVCG